MTIFNTYFFKDNKLYKITSEGNRIPVDSVSDKSYRLLISDDYFFYMSLEIPSGAQKPKEIVRHYLMANFPEEITSEFGIVSFDNNYIVFIVGRELRQAIAQKLSLFKRAKSISTPFVEQCFLRQPFNYISGSCLYSFNGKTVSLSDEPSIKALTEEQLIPHATDIKSSISLPGISNTAISKKHLVTVLLILLFSYALFLGAEFLHVKTYTTKYKRLERRIARLYREAGISDNTSDPYGMLLYKASKFKPDRSVKRVSRMLEILTEATPTGCTINRLTWNQGTVTFSGTAGNLMQIDQLKDYLQKHTKSVALENTNRTNSAIKFVVKFTL